MTGSMVPKPYAVLSDALDEGCGHAARKAIEHVLMLDSERPKKNAKPEAWDQYHRKLHDLVSEAIRDEVLTAICERFHFDEPVDQ